jgi:hypothetical protein
MMITHIYNTNTKNDRIQEKQLHDHSILYVGLHKFTLKKFTCIRKNVVTFSSCQMYKRRCIKVDQDLYTTASKTR